MWRLKKTNTDQEFVQQVTAKYHNADSQQIMQENSKLSTGLCK